MTNFMHATLAGAAATIATTGHRPAVAGAVATPTWRDRPAVTPVAAAVPAVRTVAPATAVPARKRTAVAVSAAWNPPL